MSSQPLDHCRFLKVLTMFIFVSYASDSFVVVFSLLSSLSKTQERVRKSSVYFLLLLTSMQILGSGFP